jgi:hypothetical protein
MILWISAAWGGDVCLQVIPPSSYGAVWAEGSDLELTAPPGSGWEAVVVLSARRRDGSREQWVEEVPLSAETVLHTVSPPPGDSGVLTLLRAQISFSNADGRLLQGREISSKFVVGTGRVYTETEQRFTSWVTSGGFVDPHDGDDFDQERTP